MSAAASPSRTDASSPAGLLVVDDHELVRLGLQSLVQAHAAANAKSVTVFEARTLQGALAIYAAEQSRIGLVLLDLHLPDAHGLSGLTAFLARFPAAPVVVLSGESDPALVRSALAHGARAYLTKSGDLHDVVRYVRSLGLLSNAAADGLDLAQGAAHEPPGATATAQAEPNGRDHGPARVVQFAGAGNGPPQSVRLTPRQAELLDWILTGLSNRDIAARAHLSEGTVKNHVSTLLLMFGVRSRAQLISQLR
jgi:DNA-binding NarL/FixJ family response regulator